MLPSVRGRSKAKVLALLVSTGASAAIAIALLGEAAVRSVLPSATLRARLAVGIGVSGVVLEIVLLAIERPRPFAVHRQVPQAWGHRRGPICAALRYGPRLGVGPATILTSWLWWIAFGIGCASGRRVAIIGAVMFVIGRVLTMWVVTIGVGDGRTMARRIAGWRRREITAQRLAVVAAGGCVFALGLGVV